MTQVVDLNGNIRSLVGKNVGNKLLKVGKIPAVIYGENGEPNINIELDIREFEKEYFKGNVELKIFNLNIDGKIYKVIPYLIDIHPVSDRPRHVDFIQVEGKKEIKVLIPLTFRNREKSPGLKKGGYLNIISRKIQLFVDPENIPNEIVIDLAGLHLKNSVKLSQIKLPEGTRSITKKDIILCTIVGRGKSDIDEPAQQQAAAAATTATKEEKK